MEIEDYRKSLRFLCWTNTPFKSKRYNNGYTNVLVDYEEAMNVADIKNAVDSSNQLYTRVCNATDFYDYTKTGMETCNVNFGGYDYLKFMFTASTIQKNADSSITVKYYFNPEYYDALPTSISTPKNKCKTRSTKNWYQWYLNPSASLMVGNEYDEFDTIEISENENGKYIELTYINDIQFYTGKYIFISYTNGEGHSSTARFTASISDYLLEPLEYLYQDEDTVIKVSTNTSVLPKSAEMKIEVNKQELMDNAFSSKIYDKSNSKIYTITFINNGNKITPKKTCDLSMTCPPGFVDGQ